MRFILDFVAFCLLLIFVTVGVAGTFPVWPGIPIYIVEVLALFWLLVRE